MTPLAPLDRTVAIGIDIGATTTRVGLVTSSARLLTKRSVATPDHAERMAAWLTHAIDEICDESRAGSPVVVGLGLPGVVEANAGRVTRCVRLPFIEGDWLGRSLADHVRRPVVLTTDMDAAALSEWHSLATAPARFAHLRLGTGVGLGVVVDGKPQPIEPGRVTHAAVLVVDERPNATRCACGLQGCLETVAGGAALTAAAHAMGLDGLPELQQAYDRKEPAVGALVEGAARAMARVAHHIQRLYRPDVLVLGGGVIEHLPALYERTAEQWREVTASDLAASDVTTDSRPLRVDRAQLGDDAGIIGAALLAAARRTL